MGVISQNKTRFIGSAADQAKQIINDCGSIIRTTEAIKAGIHPRIIYQLRDSGELEQLSRGIYRLKVLDEISNPDLVIVATRIPRAVICLISALAYQEITTQIPHKISIALPRNFDTPRLDHPPIFTHRFSAVSFREGIEIHQIDGVSVKIYNPEKTIADCFKFRNKIGMDVVLEALKLYKTRMRFDVKKLLYYAKICRVDKVMFPYLEASL